MAKWMGDKPTVCEYCHGAFTGGVFHDAPRKGQGSWGLICTACRGGGTVGQTYDLKTMEKIVSRRPDYLPEEAPCGCGHEAEAHGDPAIEFGGPLTLTTPCRRCTCPRYAPPKRKAAKKTARLPRISISRIMLLNSSGQGMCVLCGHEQGPIEPDAKKVMCESCGKSSVFGAEELVFFSNPLGDESRIFVTLHGNQEYEVKVVDPTHVTMALVGGSGTPWAYHVQQLDDETCRQLQAKGVMDKRRYVKSGAQECGYCHKKFPSEQMEAHTRRCIRMVGGEYVPNPPRCAGCGGTKSYMDDYGEVFCANKRCGRHYGHRLLHLMTGGSGEPARNWCDEKDGPFTEDSRKVTCPDCIAGRDRTKRPNPPYRKPSKVESSTAEVMNLAKLPQECFVLDKYSGELRGIVKGEMGYRRISSDLIEKFGSLDALNAALGVSIQQREAMLAGSMFGWHIPAANPDNYDDEGMPKRTHRPNPQSERPGYEVVPCEGCGKGCYESPCMDCVRARHAGVVGCGCSCGKKRRPKLVDLGFRAFYSCQRCLAPITAMRVKGSKER